MSYNSKIIIPFNYVGSKYSHAKWVIDHLPQTKGFVDVFGGAAIILLNKRPSQIETYNDINSTVVNFFRCLRNNTDELLHKIYLTPYSREEYLHCYRTMSQGTNIEKAYKFFVTVCQSFNGTYSRQTGWKMSTNESRAFISESISRWNSKIPNLISTIKRLKSVQILNYDFRVIFKKFNFKHTLLYCDPPYLHNTRSSNNEYEFEMTIDDHVDFLDLCLISNCKIAISGYDSDLYNNILTSANGWHKSLAKKKRNGLLHSSHPEILWTNYDPEITTNLFSSHN